MKEVTLSSGAILKINAAPFAQAKALYQAFLKELRQIEITSETEMASVYKDVFCASAASKEFEACLWECMKRCLYCGPHGELKIDASTFEPLEVRADYTTVCMEVAKENIDPFVKSLLSEFGPVLNAMISARK